ncbi:Uncharacterised protein [Serratia quinivorans]|nr:Uncharacterised protein [Serratia quinivorans]
MHLYSIKSLVVVEIMAVTVAIMAEEEVGIMAATEAEPQKHAQMMLALASSLAR